MRLRETGKTNCCQLISDSTMYCNLNFLQCTVIIETFKNLKEIFHVSDNHEGTEAGE